MSKTVGVGKAVVMLQALVVLSLRGMLVLRMRVVVEHAGHSSTTTIQPGAMALLMILRVHADDKLIGVRSIRWLKYNSPRARAVGKDVARQTIGTRVCFVIS